MKHPLFLQTILILSFILTACSSPDDRRLEQALVFAGSNRGELEKVLSNYTDEPEKLEAARFLIRNMPRWYGYKGWQLDSIKPVLVQGAKDRFFNKDVVQKWQNVSFNSLQKVYEKDNILLTRSIAYQT